MFHVALYKLYIDVRFDVFLHLVPLPMKIRVMERSIDNNGTCSRHSRSQSKQQIIILHPSCRFVTLTSIVKES